MLTDHRNVTVKKSMLKPNLPLDKGHFITVYSAVSAMGMASGLGFVHTGHDLSFVYDIACEFMN